ncbi:hypothetical protein J2X76_003634 [Neorhizobium sp. 2083]|uniref:hypothetical protein n=1 Tax=Neorhizobium sp. 2083 TaxID=2817762 RepID=UPI00285ADA8A|nr:hypothetical protein [Neorhizobium sp. 2083]MDR6818457.1 hypothetical protein [Neorhizobium sp. 2083]
MRDLGHFPKASADHVLVFTPKTKDFLAVFAVFIVVLAIGITISELRDQARQFETAERV